MLDFRVPEVGENIESGTVVTINVAVGDTVTKDQDLFEFETEKASLPVPCSCDGVIKEILIKEGEDVNVGQVVMKIETADAPAPSDEAPTSPEVQASTPVEEATPEGETASPAAAKQEKGIIDFQIPEVGENITSGTVVSIMVAVGDTVTKDQDLFEFETEKASLPVPCPCDGVIKEILIKEGDEVAVGQMAMKIEGIITSEASPASAKTQAVPTASAPAAAAKPAPAAATTTLKASEDIPAQTDIPAAPSVRRFARETGVEISRVAGSGPGGRISKDDVKAYIKQLLTGGGLPAAAPAAKPLPDFSKWGEIEPQKMSNIRKKTASHLSDCWNTIPHVTQFDKADITDIEKLRKAHSTEERKLTITPFLMKILASALKEFAQFNSSVDMENKQIILKKFVHIGVAVDTDRGLLVPVIRDVDQKDVFTLTDELNAAAERARTKKTALDELAGGSLTLTNLGGIGGTSFTPIVNWPEVAIMGVSRGRMEPVFDKEKKSFTPRFMLPLSLSYDHRIVDGADGARFIRYVVAQIENPNFSELKG